MGIDTDLLEQRLALRRICTGDVRCTPGTDDLVTVDHDLVALGVPAEVVMVVEHQHLRFRQRLLEVIRRCQAAQPSAHDNQVVDFARILWVVPGLAVAHLVRHLERALVATPHSGQARRIVLIGILEAAFRRRRDARVARRRGRRPGASRLSHPAPPIATLAPLRKSRRVMARSIPSSRSVNFIAISSFRRGQKQQRATRPALAVGEPQARPSPVAVAQASTCSLRSEQGIAMIVFTAPRLRKGGSNPTVARVWKR